MHESCGFSVEFKDEPPKKKGAYMEYKKFVCMVEEKLNLKLEEE